MVKITTRALKIGVQSRFYPISTLGFRTFFSENFGLAYYTGSIEIMTDRMVPLIILPDLIICDKIG